MNPSYNRLYWSCRRGMLELDLILIPFLENQYAELEQIHQQQFQELLNATDMELFAWLTGKELPDDESTATIVKRIREYAHDPDRNRQI